MRLLVDTHLLLWAAMDVLPQKAVPYFTDENNELVFSSASIWEVVIKNGLKRRDFRVDPIVLYRGLLDNGYLELPVTSQHVLFVTDLPLIHRDPFDRILIAQAKAENLTLLSSDKNLSRYSPVIYVQNDLHINKTRKK